MKIPIQQWAKKRRVPLMTAYDWVRKKKIESEKKNITKTVKKTIRCIFIDDKIPVPSAK